MCIKSAVLTLIACYSLKNSVSCFGNFGIQAYEMLSVQVPNPVQFSANVGKDVVSEVTNDETALAFGEVQIPHPVKFSKNVETEILNAVDQCVSNPTEKYKNLLLVKQGKFLFQPSFIEFIFCSYTKSGYADKTTGRVFLEYTASVYPEECNEIEVLKKCDKVVRHTHPVAALFDFFMCFQKNTLCRIDLLPDDIPNIPTPQIPDLESFTKDVEKDILIAADQAVDQYVSLPIRTPTVPHLVKLSKDVENDILFAVDQCVSSPIEKNTNLLLVKEGQFSFDPSFIDFIFCSYTKSGYADERTGRVFLEYTASVYPEECNQIEVLKKCDNQVKHSDPVAALFDFFMCLQKNTLCRIDFLPDVVPNIPTPQILNPVTLTKEVEKDIVMAVDNVDIATILPPTVPNPVTLTKDVDKDIVMAVDKNVDLANILPPKVPNPVTLTKDVEKDILMAVNKNVDVPNILSPIISHPAKLVNNVEKDILKAVDKTVDKSVSLPNIPSSTISHPVKFSKDVETDILNAVDECVSSPIEKLTNLLIVKQGKILHDKSFKDFVFCAHTKSGYADETTGRILIEHTASVYPEECNQKEVLKKCDKLVKHSDPVAALFDFFVCFQKNTLCRIDLLPDDVPNVLSPTTIPHPVKFTKDVQKNILIAVDQCVSSPIEKLTNLLVVKQGKILHDKSFKEYLFCACTKSGFADETTGRVFIERTASVYPEECNQKEVLKKCDKLVKHTDPVAALFDFFVCFQKNTLCRIDLLPDDVPNISTPRVQAPHPVKFSKDVENDILVAIDQCVSSPSEKYDNLLLVKQGKFVSDPSFKDFVFCSYTKSGYADKTTGRVFLEHTASVYPKECNEIEVLKKCDKLVKHSDPVAALFDFFKCFQKNSLCLIDLLPDGKPNTCVPSQKVQTPHPVKFSKDVENDILVAIDQCVSSPSEKYDYLLLVKQGKFVSDLSFKDFVFCSYTKSGYADETTGRVFLEHTASVYPKECNEIEVLKKCDKLVEHSDPVAALFDFFKCFQKNTLCRIDLLPDSKPNTCVLSQKIPHPVKFSKDVENHILVAVDQCVSSPSEKYANLLLVKQGKILTDSSFKDFIFCSYTKSGYADETTGRVFLEHTASVYPKECNEIEVLKKCDKLVKHSDPVAALFDFFKCFQKNTLCRIDLLPDDVTDLPFPIISKPVKFTKEITESILIALDQCVSNPYEKYYNLYLVKEGIFIPDRSFKEFIFCSYTKSGYADEDTGRVLLEYTASIYPEHCNEMEVLKKCDSFVRHSDPVEAMADFFKCFQKYTPCRIDLLPDFSDVLYPSVPNLQIPRPVKFSKHVERGILNAVDQCVSSPSEKYYRLSLVKEGAFLTDPSFINFIFCSYTKSGYANVNTGRVFLKHAASVFPPYCNQLQVMKKCDMLVKHKNPTYALFDFFKCFQENTLCRIDLLPDNVIYPPPASPRALSSLSLWQTPRTGVIPYTRSFRNPFIPRFALRSFF